MKTLSISCMLIFLAACASGPTNEGIDEASTQSILDHHFATFKANDLDGVMTDYTEESVVVTPNGTYKGLTAIRDNFANAFKILPTAGTNMTVNKTTVTGDVAYVIWSATTPTLAFKFATDTFIIRSGKILRQTYAGDVAPMAADSTATN